MKDKKENKDKRKTTVELVYSIFNGQSVSVPYCTPDQCFMTNPQAFSTTNIITPIHSKDMEQSNPANKTDSNSFTSSTNLSQVFPSELLDLIKEAAQQGFLISLLISLLNEGATDYFKSLHYSPDKIYWINQGVRSLLLIALGSSAGLALGTPCANFVMHSFLGFKKENANYLITGIVLGINLFTNPISLVEASIALGTSVGASFLGSKFTHLGYPFVRSGFFKIINNEETQCDDVQAPQIIH